MKTKRSKKKPILSGKLTSGTLFIGDPTFMTYPKDIRLNEQFKEYNAVEPDEYNPFKRSEDHIDEVLVKGDKELEILPFVGGRGVLLATEGLIEGKFEVKKKIDKVSGKITKITIEIKG